MAKKKISLPQKSSSKRLKTLPTWAVPEMESAASDFEKGNWNAARKTLEFIDARCPRRPEVLALLAVIYDDHGESGRLLRTCRQMCEISPGDPDALAMSVHGYLLNHYPTLALHALDQLLAEYPHHAAAEEFREVHNDIRKFAEIQTTGAGLSLDDNESALLHEELNVLLGEGRLKDAEKVANRLLERLPHFTPALNNLSQLQWLQGQKQKAVTTAERAVQQNPDNVHALSNLVTYCFLSGREAEAREWSRQVVASTAVGFDVGFKKAEALSYIGDDEAVVALYLEAQAQNLVQSPGSDAAMGHMAAVAAWRLGREAEAREWWKKWQDDEENMLGATLHENLDDLKKPVGERNGPWALPFSNWMNRSLVDDIFKIINANKVPTRSASRDRSLERRTSRKLWADHPELDTLIPAFLDRGAPACREFALMLCGLARTPKCLEALHDFAMGQRGTDSDRTLAAQILREENALNSGNSGLVKLWRNGEWRETLLMAFELHAEADQRFSRAETDLLMEAQSALEQGNPVIAETIFRRVLADRPDDPSLCFNLALALSFQGKKSESEKMEDEIHERYPEYLHARVAIARRAIVENDLERAESLLQPVFDLHRLHFSEYALLAVAQIELSLAQDKLDAAESWLELFRDVLPDHPAIPTLNQQMAAARPKIKKRK